MPIKADCHIHSHHSGDSHAPMRAQIESALSAGLSALCFTEHYDPVFPYENIPELAPGTFDLDLAAYRDEFLSLQEEYRGRIRLHFGVELGLQPHIAKELECWTAAAPDLEFIIGSVHVLDGRDPYYPEVFAGRTDQEVFRSYFEEVLACVKAFHSFHSMGHLDYIVRYGQSGRDALYRPADYLDVADEILKILIDHGIALEVNTAPLSKGCRECNPASLIVRRYKELGGERITVRSDAHAPEKIAQYFKTAEQMLLSCGFRYYCVFDHKEPSMLPLGE